MTSCGYREGGCQGVYYLQVEKGGEGGSWSFSLCDINRMQQSSMRQWGFPKDKTESGKRTLPRGRDRRKRVMSFQSWSGERYVHPTSLKYNCSSVYSVFLKKTHPETVFVQSSLCLEVKKECVLLKHRNFILSLYPLWSPPAAGVEKVSYRDSVP